VGPSLRVYRRVSDSVPLTMPPARARGHRREPSIAPALLVRALPNSAQFCMLLGGLGLGLPPLQAESRSAANMEEMAEPLNPLDIGAERPDLLPTYEAYDVLRVRFDPPPTPLADVDDARIGQLSIPSAGGCTTASRWERNHGGGGSTAPVSTVRRESRRRLRTRCVHRCCISCRGRIVA
jgi:hypothetical protein